MAAHPDDLQSTYRIFISFTGADKELAEYLARELRRILNDYDVVYCFSLPGTQDSRAGSRPADDFGKLIDDRLRKCNVFILLWSEAARRQSWVNYELNHARNFLRDGVKRMKREFKVIPISINRCSIPFGLNHLVHAHYTSGGDLQVTLNQVLSALGLPAEHDDPHEIFLKRVIFEVETAFSREEWSVVVQKYSNLAQGYPNVVSPAMHYKCAIALLTLERTAQSLMAMDEGLKLGNKEEDTAFIEQYIHRLKEKRLWNEVRILVEKAIAKFPGDVRWHQFWWDVMNNHTSASSTFFLPPNHQMTQQPQQTVSVSANGTNGAMTSIANGQNASFVSLQQFPSLLQGGFIPNEDDFSSASTRDAQVSDIRSAQASSDQKEHVTRRLSEEELQLEIEDNSWQKANGFTEKHISHRKIERLLEPSMVFIAILNMVYVAIVSLFLPFNTPFIIPEVIGVLIFLYVGRFIDAESIKFICIVFLMVFWAITGYSCGYRFYIYLGWGAGSSVGICMGMIFTIIIVSFGGRFHVRLFHSAE